MNRLHAIAVSLVLGAAAAGGAAAALHTVHLGQASAAPKPARVPASVLAARRAKLATWSRSLVQTARTKPPALPSVPSFPRVEVPAVPAQQVVAAAPAPTVRHVRVVEPARTSEPPEQVTYVQAPPVVQYQQAAGTPATTTSRTRHEDDGEERDDGDRGGTGTSGGGDGSGGDD